MSAPSTSGLSVELLLRVIDVKYGYFTLLLHINGYSRMIPSVYMEEPYLKQSHGPIGEQRCFPGTKRRIMLESERF